MQLGWGLKTTITISKRKWWGGSGHERSRKMTNASKKCIKWSSRIVARSHKHFAAYMVLNFFGCLFGPYNFTSAL